MDLQTVWRLFWETGDPLCYLLARRLSERENLEERKSAKQFQADFQSA